MKLREISPLNFRLKLKQEQQKPIFLVIFQTGFNKLLPLSTVAGSFWWLKKKKRMCMFSTKQLRTPYPLSLQGRWQKESVSVLVVIWCIKQLGRFPCRGRSAHKTADPCQRTQREWRNQTLDICDRCVGTQTKQPCLQAKERHLNALAAVVLSYCMV